MVVVMVVSKMHLNMKCSYISYRFDQEKEKKNKKQHCHIFDIIRLHLFSFHLSEKSS